MGVRISKALGYGLVDLAPRDPRVDWARVEELREGFDYAGFSSFCRQRLEELRAIGSARLCALRLNQLVELPLLLQRLDQEGERCGLERHIVYDPEFCDSKLLLVVSPLLPHHLRYNDTLDYYSESVLDQVLSRAGQALQGLHDAEPVRSILGELRDSWTVIGAGIYPHEAWYERATGKPTDGQLAGSLTALIAAGDLKTADALALEQCGLSATRYLAGLGRVVPGSTQLLIEYAGIMSHAVVAELEPVFCRYWC